MILWIQGNSLVEIRQGLLVITQIKKATATLFVCIGIFRKGLENSAEKRDCFLIALMIIMIGRLVPYQEGILFFCLWWLACLAIFRLRCVGFIHFINPPIYFYEIVSVVLYIFVPEIFRKIVIGRNLIDRIESGQRQKEVMWEGYFNLRLAVFILVDGAAYFQFGGLAYLIIGNAWKWNP
jgi:hypothetical protein